jgi:hypothetical protein
VILAFSGDYPQVVLTTTGGDFSIVISGTGGG